jgi:hypothetical protein
MLAPKVIIPCHYRAETAVAVLSTLQSADAWVDAQPDVIRLEKPSCSFERSGLDGFRGTVFYFGNQYVRE